MDYEELGFKCGIEIHQQLDTETKLFCNCSTDNANVSAYSKITRNLRPVPGESGAVDEAAKFEYLKSNEFVYNVYRDLSCLVEVDEEPPHEPDKEALETAVQFALMIDSEIPDEIHFMRKTVLDGSNTSGFQRTAMVGLDGKLETEQGEVKIPDIELEEESAGIHRRKENKAVYDLDRLGIPLIEIGTDASIKNPEHAKQVALKLGMLLRSTRNVKRGLGTIRQDVNVSIEGGARVEIKGFQDVRNLDKVVRNEVERQKTLLELRNKLDGEFSEDSYEDVTGVFEGSENRIIGAVLENGGNVFALKAELEGLMNKELCPGKTLGSELADYSKAQGLKGMMHTDEKIEKYGLVEEFEKVSGKLGKKDGETIIIVAGPEETAENAIKAVSRRIKDLYRKIPEETRTANDDFTTDYARPLPGAARMYPETDVSPVVLDEDYLEELKENVPETLDDKEERLSEELGSQLAEQIIRSDWLDVFEEVLEKHDFELKFVANYFVNMVPDVESRNDLDASVLETSDFEELLELYNSGKVSKDSLKEVTKYKIMSPERNSSEIVDEEGMGKFSEEDVRNVVEEVVSEKKDLIEEQGEHARGALMGVVMKRIGNKADGSNVNKVLSEELKKHI